MNDLKFRTCEGYYSKAAHACTWPCSITQMDSSDQMDHVYEALVHWADAVIIASPIRWGAASSLYFKMAERLNCVQNAMTIRNQVLIRNGLLDSLSSGDKTIFRRWRATCWVFSPNLASYFPSSPILRAHAAGHTKIWNAMLTLCGTLRSSPKARRCLPNDVSN